MRIRDLTLLLLLGGVLSCLTVSPAEAQPLTAEMAQSLRRILEPAPDRSRGDAGGFVLADKEVLPEFYRERDFRPAWFDDQGLSLIGRQLLDSLRGAGTEGLCPEDYRLAHIEPLVRLHDDYQRFGILFDASYMARLDLLLSDAFLRYVQDLVAGRVDPHRVHEQWRARPRRVDLQGTLRKALDAESLPDRLQGLAPPHEGYAALRAALVRYRRISALGGWPDLPEGPVLRSGQRDPRLPRLRAHLKATGDLEAPEETAGRLYDGATERALIRFQERHGLKADGVLGPQTRKALNVPVEDRIRQLELNLERWRWLPQSLGRRHLAVNIADYSLRVVEAGRTVMSMMVVVGTSYRKTPVFQGRMTYLEFAPYWKVPPTILREDKLPKIKADPAWLQRHHIEIVSWEGDERIDPDRIDWEQAEAGDLPGMLRQKPGPWNPLGQVKFMFPNRYSVYLHDTPDRHLFRRDVRSFSSGCIRIERPLDLAQYLLEDWWDCDLLLDALKSTHPLRVDLPRPLPVHIQYWTAWVDEQGRVNFRDDVYWRDADLDLALRYRQGAP